jgi:hypothetical protein
MPLLRDLFDQHIDIYMAAFHEEAMKDIDFAPWREVMSSDTRGPIAHTSYTTLQCKWKYHANGFPLDKDSQNDYISRLNYKIERRAVMDERASRAHVFFDSVNCLLDFQSWQGEQYSGSISVLYESV